MGLLITISSVQVLMMTVTHLWCIRCAKLVLFQVTAKVTVRGHFASGVKDRKTEIYKDFVRDGTAVLRPGVQRLIDEAVAIPVRRTTICTAYWIFCRSGYSWGQFQLGSYDQLVLWTASLHDFLSIRRQSFTRRSSSTHCFRDPLSDLSAMVETRQELN